MPRILHFGFKLVWIISVFVFARFAYDAHESMGITLPRFQGRIPPEYNVQIGNIRFQDVINGLADTHDKSVAELETSIRSSATLSFHLNLMCCFAALIGLATQFGQYRHDESQKAIQKHNASKDDGKQLVTVPRLQDRETKHDENTGM